MSYGPICDALRTIPLITYGQNRIGKAATKRFGKPLLRCRKPLRRLADNSAEELRTILVQNAVRIANSSHIPPIPPVP